MHDGCSKDEPAKAPAPRRVRGGLALALLIGASAPGRAAEPLRWKFSTGDVLKYEVLADRSTAIDLGAAGEETRRLAHQVDMTWTVDSVAADGSAVIRQKVDRLQLTLTAPEEDEVKIDSADAGEPQGFAAMAAPLVKSILDGDVRVTVTPRGEVTAVEPSADLLTALENSVGKDVMGDLASKKGLELLARSATLQLPEKLEDGVEWSTKVETTSPLLGTLTAETTYKYLGPKEVDGQPCEAFAPRLKLSLRDGPGRIAVSEEKSSGEILFNRAQGRLESARVEHEMTLAIESGGDELKQQIKQRVETRWKGEE